MAEKLFGTRENRGHKGDVTAWHIVFGVYVVNNKNNNGNKNKSDIHTPRNVSNWVLEHPKYKTCTTNTVIYLFIYLFIYGSLNYMAQMTGRLADN